MSKMSVAGAGTNMRSCRTGVSFLVARIDGRLRAGHADSLCQAEP
jgi:hypothetical protein